MKPALTSAALTSALASLTLLVACASPMGAPAKTAAGVLTNAAGMTLYTFDKDPSDASKSVCNGDCAVKWPPHVASDGDKAGPPYAIVIRDDGSRQWAYKGKPLYTWVKDQKPGDTTGDGVNNVWRVARP